MKRKLEKEYQEYCNDLLQQMKDGGMNKLQIHLAKTMYENNRQAYNDFTELYNENNIEITFTPEEKTQ